MFLIKFETDDFFFPALVYNGLAVSHVIVDDTRWKARTVLIFLLENWCSSSGGRVAAGVLEAIDKVMTMVVVEMVINDR